MEYKYDKMSPKAEEFINDRGDLGYDSLCKSQ